MIDGYWDKEFKNIYTYSRISAKITNFENSVRDTAIYDSILNGLKDIAYLRLSDLKLQNKDLANISNIRIGDLFFLYNILENKDGLGNTSTAYDMAVLTTYAMQNDKFRKIFSTKNYNCKSDRKNYSWQNKNKLLKYDYVTGGKTGYTKKAKRTLVTTGLINGTNIVIVTLNDSNDWETHKASYKYIKKNYKNEKILNKNKFSLDTKNLFIEDTLYIKNNFNLLINNSEKKLIKIKYFIKKDSNYDNDDIVGYASIYLNNKEVGNEDIYIKKGKRNGKIKNFFQKLFKKDVD